MFYAMLFDHGLAHSFDQSGARTDVYRALCAFPHRSHSGAGVWRCCTIMALSTCSTSPERGLLSTGLCAPFHIAFILAMAFGHLTVESVTLRKCDRLHVSSDAAESEAIAPVCGQKEEAHVPYDWQFCVVMAPRAAVNSSNNAWARFPASTRSSCEHSAMAASHRAFAGARFSAFRPLPHPQWQVWKRHAQNRHGGGKGPWKPPRVCWGSLYRLQAPVPVRAPVPGRNPGLSMNSRGVGETHCRPPSADVLSTRVFYLTPCRI